ncbi:DgyrCDS9725 [Dimorphilus gyrociliatus]|uniref:DgyrCDS9725 n=1 Tax=Dimorphilus gyrociliatus TaxID=2664684 RepID=A0A7I8VZG7_9ANNE|nr:DgyrCDS9725 [Dimorphilus gyrociliatus]
MGFILYILCFLYLSIPCESYYDYDLEPEVAIGWFKTNATIIEGEEIMLDFGIISSLDSWPYINPIECQLKSPGSVDLVIPSDSFYLKKTWPIENLELFGLNDDSSCSDKKYRIEARCFESEETGRVIDVKNAYLDLYVINSTPARHCEAPYFSQKVLGVNEEGVLVKELICYDTFGKAGSQYELISDNVLNLASIFEFQRDYYVGKIFFNTPLENIIISTISIAIGKHTQLFWNGQGNYFNGDEDSGPNLSVNLYGSTAIFSYYEADRIQVIKVNRVTRQNGESYLNVMIDESTGEMNVFDTHHNGIFQIVSNQDYEFFKPIQKNRRVTLVKVNGVVVKSYLKNTFDHNETCYTLLLNQIISPNLLEKFSKPLNRLDKML